MNIKKKLIDLNYAILQLEYGELECGGNFETDSYHVKEFLNVLPTVDAVEVVYGQWILKEDCGKHTEKFHCSVCDKIPKSLCTENYCPNCGAYMRGTRND